MPGYDASRTVSLLERLSRLMTTDSHAEDLLPVQWESIRFIDRANRFSKSAGALTAYLGLTKGTVSQTIKALENKGLVEKVSDSHDRRKVHLALTQKGKSLLKKDPLAMVASDIKALSKVNQRNLDVAAASLLQARLVAKKRQPFGQCRDCRYFASKHKNGNPHYCLLLEEQLEEFEADAICFEQNPKSLQPTT